MTFWSHKLGKADHKGHCDLSGHNKVIQTTMVILNRGGHKVGLGTSIDPLTFWSHKIGQTDHKGHLDLLGH